MTTYPNIVHIIINQLSLGFLHYGLSYIIWYRQSFYTIIGAIMLTLIPWPAFLIVNTVIQLYVLQPSTRVLRYWLIVLENYGLLYLQYYYLSELSYYYLLYPYIGMILYQIPQGLAFNHEPFALVTGRLIYSYGYVGGFLVMIMIPHFEPIAHWPLALESVRVMITKTPPVFNHKRYQFPLELGELGYLIIGTIRYYYRKWR